MFRRNIAPALLFALAAGCVAGAYAAGYPTAPVVRVETGMHSGEIRSLTTDADNRYLVTAGADKTIRLWSPQGELLKILRPPIGGNNEGRIDAVAMAPDGSLIAAGGDTCKSYEKIFCLFIFNTASGGIVKRIIGFPNGITRLEWSPDGAVVAVGLGGEGGLRLLRAADWTELGADPGYGGWVTSLHFDGRGRLATGSFDGNIRLYTYGADGLKLTAKKSTSEFELPGYSSARHYGKPLAVRFSPDGSKLAVGQSVGASWVTVMAADTLKTLHVATTRGMQQIGIEKLTWSPDGNTLYAGTGSADPRALMVRKWSDGGRGGYTDLAAGQRYTSGLLTLKDGGIVFTAGDPLLAAYDANGNKTLHLGTRAGEFYGRTESFRVSQDAAYVEFGYDRGTTLAFDVLERKLVPGQGKGPATREPVVNAGTLMFYNLWKDTRNVLAIDGAPLRMGARETSRSLAIAPDGESILVGTRGALRHYAKDGKPLWSVPTTFDVFAVNFSADGRFALATVGDGTLRWYARKTGRLLLTLFVAADKKRWVLVSPSGYYDSSVGAEDLIGWHINRGRNEAADFFPVSRLRAKFYKPEVLTAIIQSGDDSEAFKLAAAELGTTAPPGGKPPAPSREVTAASPAAIPPPAAPEPVVASAPPAKAKPPAIPDAPVAAAPVKPPAAPTVAVAPAPKAKPPEIPAAPADEYAVPDDTTAVSQQVADITRILPPVVTVISPATGSTVSSNQVTVQYTVKSDPGAPVTAVRTRVNGLGQASRNLPNAAAEVREVTVVIPSENSEVLLFAENKYGISSPVSIRLTWAGTKPKPAADEKPKLYVLAVGVSAYRNPDYRLHFAAKDADDFAAVVQKQKGALYSDVIVKLLTDENAGRDEVLAGFDWLQKQVTPKDVGIVLIAGHGINDERGNYYYLPVNADIDKLDATGVPFRMIKAHLANLHGKGLLLVDTCHSGAVMGKRPGMSTDNTAILNELSSAEYGLVVIASSTGKQFSFENAAWGNGAFTKALVEGLGGRADLKKRGRITHKMLDFYVSDRVDELTNGRQTPVNTSPLGVPDYTIALVAAPG